MLFNVQDFPKCVLGLVGCSKLHSAFPQARWARKSAWFGAKGLQSLTNFGFSKNRATTLQRLVCALEALYQAQNRPADPRCTKVYRNEHRIELHPFYTVSPRYKRAVSLCTKIHCFSRPFQDCGPLEGASKLKFSAAT